MSTEQYFNQIYKENYSNVYRLCLSYVNGNEELAEELSQEAFVKIWQNIDRFRNEAKISTWIYRIAVNTCLMYLRKLKKTEIELKTDAIEVSDDEEKDDNDRKLKMLRACIKRLDNIGKIIITLVLDEIPQKEIAEITGLTNENVRVKVHRTKGRLFKCMTLKENKNE